MSVSAQPILTEQGRRRVTINILPDDALLEVFACYMIRAPEMDASEAWQTLVHVCQRWRWIVFGSPRHLDLQLVCRPTTPVREMLDTWPPLPIAILEYEFPIRDMDNIVAALGHNDRVSTICLLVLPDWQMEMVLEAMRKPFPALIELRLGSEDETAPLDPDLFLSGSAPGLRNLQLQLIPFQGLPKLLLSATHLTKLSLFDIPLSGSGYISPEAMMTGISALTGLESLLLEFVFPRSSPDRTSQRPPPPTRTLLPALICMAFQGESGYLEHLVARIDAPLLDKLNITFLLQRSFDTPQLTRFISRTPRIKLNDEARISFFISGVDFAFPRPDGSGLELKILCSDSRWRISSNMLVSTSSISQTIGPAVKYLHIYTYLDSFDDDIENGQWLDLLRPFNRVEDLYLSWIITYSIAPALQELVGERSTEVLPGLQSLFLELPRSQLVQDVVGQFIAARQLSGHPIAVSHWGG